MQLFNYAESSYTLSRGQDQIYLYIHWAVEEIEAH